MEKYMQKKAISILVLLAFMLCPNVCFADDIRLYGAGTRVTFSEDTHCMSNEVSLRFLGKLRLCEEGCEIRLNGLRSEYSTRISGLEQRLLNQRTMYQSMVEEKDQTINKIQVETINAVSDIESSQWWKVTLSVVGGVIVGAATTATVMYLTQ